MMHILRYLQHWLSGQGPRLHVADFVPDNHPIRQWADTFPWVALVNAMEKSFAERFPKTSRRRRSPVSIRVLLALELLKHEWGASDEQICHRLRTDYAVMYACGITEVQADRSQAHFVLPQTLAQFRSRIDQALMDERLAIQAAAAMDEGLLSPAHLIVDTFPILRSRVASRSAMPTRCTRLKKSPPPRLAHRDTKRHTSDGAKEPGSQSPPRPQAGHAMFWPPVSWAGKVLLRLVRETEGRLIEIGQPLVALAQAAQTELQRTRHLGESRRQRLATTLHEALSIHAHIAQQSRRLIHGKRLGHCKIVNAYDPTIAPIVKGKSHCPAQFGRKPGILSESTAGFVFATHTPLGNPNDASYVVPLVDKVQHALQRVTTRKLAIHSVAGDLGVNDAAVRQALHDRGILSVGIPTTIEPINPTPSPQEGLDVLNAAGLNRKRTPAQVQLACACGYSRPVVESHIASLLCRGAGQLRYRGPQGATVQLGMTTMAHNGATVVRIRQQRLSKRAQKFRPLLRLRYPNINQFNELKNR